MKAIYFCDTSAIIKLYHAELGTDCMESIFGDNQCAIMISELTLVEFDSSVAKKVRTGNITDSAKNEAIKNFKKDCQDRFLVNPLDSGIVRSARKLINKYGNKLSIRALDALQLGSCLDEEQEGLHFVCADSRLNKICKLEGVSTINPETIDDKAN
ncbi:MAG: type II toxin-antitoxin system VapC family toxin [Deltaproteobacteria bacterium]|nr:type II toxin-antitoxin system VapC family toxin [Deltaproteobacteria bacterium]